MMKMDMQSCLITGEGTTLKEFGTDPSSRRIAVLHFPSPPLFTFCYASGHLSGTLRLSRSDAVRKEK